MSSLVSSAFSLADSLLTSPSHTRYVLPLLLLGEIALCALIIFFVPYTEIDYTTYLAQARVYLSGERHYIKITGPSGPCVYPALHLYIYSGIDYVTQWITGDGTRSKEDDLRIAQVLFAGLYLVALTIVIQCYKKIGAPGWLLMLLVGSKRLHSIFLLRMFNDCFATLGLWLSIYLLQRRQWQAAAVVWGLGLGVKMTLLLAAPGLAFVLVQGAGLQNALIAGFGVASLHALIGMPFLQTAPWEYLHSAFDFGRAFLFKWTVNWRFLGEGIFLSRAFSLSLLLVHVSSLIIFATTTWIAPTSHEFVDFVHTHLERTNIEIKKMISRKVTPMWVMDTVLASMVVGLLCARSLHYQFFAYLGWATPYLLWRTGAGAIWVAVNWAVQEYCWLVFPSTSLSSMVVVFELALQVLSILLAPSLDQLGGPPGGSFKPMHRSTAGKVKDG
jgi:alpha-1,3-mannosyltransferase